MVGVREGCREKIRRSLALRLTMLKKRAHGIMDVNNSAMLVIE